MSLTDYRRLIDIGTNDMVTVECSDGVHVTLTVTPDAQLVETELDALIAALIGAKVALHSR